MLNPLQLFTPFDPRTSVSRKTLAQLVRALFANNEKGVWYDPSDFSTMFQESVGITPVTAVGQPVGLLLDKSKGGYVPLTGGVWAKTSGDGVVSVVGNQITITGATTSTRVDYSVHGPLNSHFKINVTYTGSPVSPEAFLDGIPVTFNNTVSTGMTNGVHIVRIASGSAVFTINTFDILVGNHAAQATTASKPILARHPATGKRNIALHSEDLTFAGVWGVVGTTLPVVTANQTVAPDGLVTADTIVFGVAGSGNRVQQLLTYNVTGTYVASIYLKGAVGGESIRLWDGQGTQVTCTLTTSWQRFEVTAVITNQTFNILLYALSGTPTIYAWGAQIELGSTATAYQKTTTIYDTTEAGVADLHYLRFDGVDDSLATAAIDFSATDKMSVFAGVRKLSDAAVALVVELGAASNAGFYLGAPEDISIRFSSLSRGSAGASASQRADGAGNAPITVVASSNHDISGDLTTLRINTTASTNATGDKGTGNFGNLPLHIGRRGGFSLPFNGHLYSMIVRGALSDAAQITAAESYVNSKTKAYS